jgi:uroporphyrinogen-III synthase
MQSLLQGIQVLICRPAESALELAQALTAVGARCCCFPTLSIEFLSLSPEARNNILNLDQYQHVIVTSQHAAKAALQAIDSLWPQFPVRQQWYPIGEKTASILKQEQLNLVEPNQSLTSESLLAIPELQKIREHKILLLKGTEGRDVLATTLRKRGAFVDELELYERSCPAYTDKEILEAMTDFPAHFIVTLSGETLQNLISLCDQAHIDASSKTFIVPSHRVANIAYERGFKSVLIPANLKAIDIIKCITTHKKNLK